MMAQRKETCEHCGGKYVPKYIGTHMRRIHGIAGGISGKPRSKALVPTTKAQPVGLFRRTPFIILEDGEGEFWIAEPMRGRRG
jgi:hypothetical protein